MQTVDMEQVIRDILVTLNAQRANDSPTVRLIISPGLPTFFWRDDSLQRLLQEIFDEVLRSNRGDWPLQIQVCSRPRLQDLQAFIGISPVCWIKIRFSGHGLPSFDGLIESKLRRIGYYCDEWIGVQNAASQLAIFCSERGEALKLVLYLSTDRFKWKCDFLIPVIENCLPDAA